jgi:hypothetical protein
MRWLQRVGRDLSEGRNIEVYVTVLIALTVGLLGAFSVVRVEVVVAVILATLGLLALSTIKSRDQVGTLQSKIMMLSGLVEEKVLGQSRADDFLLAARPDYEVRLQSAASICMVGLTLSRTTRDSLDVFRARLREGADLRMAVIDPDSDAADEAALRCYGQPTGELFRNRIKPTIDMLELLASRPELTGSIELRLLPFAPCFGLVLIDPDHADGVIYVELYQHKSLGQNPLFVLEAQRDSRWYRFFRGQFQTLWDSGRETQLDGGNTLPRS